MYGYRTPMRQARQVAEVAESTNSQLPGNHQQTNSIQQKVAEVAEFSRLSGEMHDNIANFLRTQKTTTQLPTCKTCTHIRYLTGS